MFKDFILSEVRRCLKAASHFNMSNIIHINLKMSNFMICHFYWANTGSFPTSTLDSSPLETLCPPAQNV